MLPDFPRHKEHIERLLRDRLIEILTSDGLMGIIPRRHTHEGSRLHTSSADGYEKTTDYVQHSFEQAISHDEIVAKGPIAYFDRLPQVAHELLLDERKLMKYIREYNKNPRVVKWRYVDPSRHLGA